MDETAPEQSQSQGQGLSPMNPERQQPEFEQAQVERIKAELLNEERARAESDTVPGALPMAEWKEKGINAMAGFDPDADPDAFDPRARMSEAERYALDQARERGHSTEEALRNETEPEVLRAAMRGYLGREEQGVYLDDMQPSAYVYDNMLRTLRNRTEEIEMVRRGHKEGVQKRVNGTDQWTDRDTQGRRNPVYLNEGELKELYIELSNLTQEFLARISFLGMFNNDQKIAGSTDDILKMLEAKWRVTPQARYFRDIGRLSETKEGEKQFGELVNDAWQLWVDLAENRRAGDADKGSGRPGHVGEVVGTGAIGAEDRILNPFRDFHWDSNLQKSISFIASELTGQTVQSPITPETRFDMGDKLLDAERAAVLAYGLFKITHMDLTYSIYLERGKLKIAVSQVDATKVTYPSTRQFNEEMKDIPYAAGMYSVAGVFPGLIKNFFETCKLTPVKHKEQDEKVSARITFWDLWRKRGVPLGELPFDTDDWREGRGYLPAEFRGDEFRLEGESQRAIDVPWRLAMDYAEDWFQLLYGMDMEKGLLGVATSETELMKKNKPLDVLMYLTYPTMKQETHNALMQFTKVTWLAGVLVSSTEKTFNLGQKSSREERRKRAMAAPNQYNKLPSINDLKGRILPAAESAGFIRPGESMQTDLELFEKIINARRGFMPHELIGKFFTETQVREIYNSGAYDFSPFLDEVSSGDDEDAARRYRDSKTIIENLREPRYSELRRRIEY